MPAKFIPIFYFSPKFVKENLRIFTKQFNWPIIHKNSFNIHIDEIAKPPKYTLCGDEKWAWGQGEGARSLLFLKNRQY